MRIEQVFLSLDLAIGSYRRAVGTILPALTKVAWQIKSQEIRKEAPGITRKKFLYNLSRSSYEKNWGELISGRVSGRECWPAFSTSCPGSVHSRRWRLRS